MMGNYRKFTEEDLKIIKAENKTNYMLCLLLFSLIAVVNLLIYVTIGNIDSPTLLVDLALIIIATTMVHNANKLRNKDLEERVKRYELRKVIETRKETDHTTRVGIIMKPYDKYTLFLASNNVEVHTVDEKLYKTVKSGDFVEVYYSKNANSFLGIALHNESI